MQKSPKIIEQLSVRADFLRYDGPLGSSRTTLRRTAPYVFVHLISQAIVHIRSGCTHLYTLVVKKWVTPVMCPPRTRTRK